MHAYRTQLLLAFPADSLEEGARQGRTLNLLGDMRRLSSFCASMAVPSMPSSPYRNCTTLPFEVRTVPSYLQVHAL